MQLLPMWDHICPRCRKEVTKNSLKCPYCHENFGAPLRVPPRVLKDQKALEDYVHKNIFPNISQLDRKYLSQYFTVLFSDGQVGSTMETVGDFSAWTDQSTNAGGSISVANDFAHHGVSSAKVTGIQNVTDGARSRKTLAASYASLYMRGYVRVDSTPDAGPFCTGLAFRNTTNGLICKTVWDPVNGWGVRYSASSFEYEAVPSGWTAATSYCLELYCLVGDVAGALKLWVNDNLKVDADGLAIGAAEIQNAVIGVWTNDAAQAAARTLWVDCVVVADAGPIGVEAAGEEAAIAFRGWKDWWHGPVRAVNHSNSKPFGSRFPKFVPRQVC